jgi:hypothetical protein
VVIGVSMVLTGDVAGSVGIGSVGEAAARLS